MPPSVAEEYAIHLASGENADWVNIAVVDDTLANAAACRSFTENTQSDIAEPFVMLKRKRSPLGIHDSARCEVPGSGFVRRSGAPVPSARCHQIPLSPSRSIWNATRSPLADQMGAWLRPSKVIRRIALVPASS